MTKNGNTLTIEMVKDKVTSGGSVRFIEVDNPKKNMYFSPEDMKLIGNATKMTVTALIAE
jgi:hypothetical protein